MNSRNVRQSVGSLLCVLLLLISSAANTSSGQDWELLECVDSRHSAFVYVEAPGELIDQFAQSDLCHHPLIVDVQNQMNTDAGKQALLSFGFQLPDDPAEVCEQISDLFPGPMTVLVSIRRDGNLDFLVSLESTIEDAKTAAQFIGKILGLRLAEEHAPLVPDPDGIVRLALPRFSLFVSNSNGRCLVSNSQKKLGEVNQSLGGITKPARTFATNRKFLRGLAQSKRLQGSLVASGFLDPSLIKRLAPPAISEYLNVLGLSNVTTIFFDCRTPEAMVRTESPQFIANCWIGTTVPRSPLFDALLSPTTPWSIPDNLELEHGIETLAVRCAPIKLFNAIEQQVDDAFGDDTLVQLVKRIEKAEGVRTGFATRLLSVFGGQYLSVIYEDPSKKPVQVLSCDDEAKSTELISEFVNRKSKGPVNQKKPIVGNDGVTRWDWSVSQLTEYQKTMGRRFGLKKPAAFRKLFPSAFALCDGFAFLSSLDRIRSLGVGYPRDLAEHSFYRPIVESLKAHDSKISVPILVWTTTPEYWRTSVGTFHWQLERKYGKDVVLIAVDEEGSWKDIDFSTENAELFLDQIKLHVLYAACDTFGKTACSAFGDEFGLRLNFMLFHPEEKK